MLFAPPSRAATPSPSSRAHQTTMSPATTHRPTTRAVRIALTPLVMYPAATHRQELGMFSIFVESTLDRGYRRGHPPMVGSGAVREGGCKLATQRSKVSGATFGEVSERTEVLVGPCRRKPGGRVPFQSSDPQTATMSGSTAEAADPLRVTCSAACYPARSPRKPGGQEVLLTRSLHFAYTVIVAAR